MSFAWFGSAFAFACAVLFSVLCFSDFIFLFAGSVGNFGFVNFCGLSLYFANCYIFSVFEKLSSWSRVRKSLNCYVFENFSFSLVLLTGRRRQRPRPLGGDSPPQAWARGVDTYIAARHGRPWLTWGSLLPSPCTAETSRLSLHQHNTLACNHPLPHLPIFLVVLQALLGLVLYS